MRVARHLAEGLDAVRQSSVCTRAGCPSAASGTGDHADHDDVEFPVDMRVANFTRRSRNGTLPRFHVKQLDAAMQHESAQLVPRVARLPEALLSSEGWCMPPRRVRELRARLASWRRIVV